MAAANTVSVMDQCPSIVVTENTCYGPELNNAWKAYKTMLDKARHGKPPVVIKTYQDVVANAGQMLQALTQSDSGLQAQGIKAVSGDPYASANLAAFFNAMLTDMSNKFLGCNKVDAVALVITILIIVGFLVAVAYM